MTILKNYDCEGVEISNCKGFKYQIWATGVICVVLEKKIGAFK